jgi:hypothetical protein
VKLGFFSSLQQHNFMLSYNNLPDLASSHFTDVSASTYDYIVPNPSLVKDFSFLAAYSFPPPFAQYFNYYSGDYAFVLEILFTYDWSCAYSHTSPNSTVEQLSTVVNKSLDFFLPYCCHSKSKYLNWFPNTLKYYIHSKSNFYCQYKKNLSPDLCNKNQQDALFYSQFILIINLYMF